MQNFKEGDMKVIFQILLCVFFVIHQLLLICIFPFSYNHVLPVCLSLSLTHTHTHIFSWVPVCVHTGTNLEIT